MFTKPTNLLKMEFFVLEFAILIWIAIITPTVESCEGVTMVSRSQWKTSRALNAAKIKLPVKRVFIHHTATGQCNTQDKCSASVRSMQKHHISSNGWSDIGYNFLVGGDGKVYVGRGWDRQGAHTKGFNSDIAISFIGDFTTAKPSEAMLNVAKKLIACGVASNKIQKQYGLYGHRDAGSTSCPGNSLYAIIKKWPQYAATGKLKG